MAEFEQNSVSKACWRWTSSNVAPGKPASCRPRSVIQFCVMMIVAAILRFGFGHGVTAGIVCGLGFFVLLSGLFLPPVFLGLERGMQRFGRFVGWLLSWILLGSFFYLVFVPARAILELRGTDPMKRGFPSDEPTYWIPYRCRPTLDRYRKQY